MTVDLRSLLTAPELGLSLRFGEPLLDRAVSWVVTTDLHDPRRYLSGGELVLTGMMWRHGAGDSESFVRRLVAAGVAGLGAGDPERGDLPADLEDACRRHHLPLFHVRSDVSFSAITEHVVRRLSAGRSADLATVLGRHRSLIETGGGLADVLGLAADEVGMSCAVLSPAARRAHARGVPCVLRLLVTSGSGAARTRQHAVLPDRADGASHRQGPPPAPRPGRPAPRPRAALTAPVSAAAHRRPWAGGADLALRPDQPLGG